MRFYVKPLLEVSDIIPDTDTMAGSCIIGDCGQKGEERIVCGQTSGMSTGQSKQGDGYYLYCVEWNCG